MVDLKDAVQNAITYLQDLPGVGAIRSPVLEEVELTDDERHWMITLSYYEDALFGGMQRKYKIFKVEVATGRVVAMKIRSAK